MWVSSVRVSARSRPDQSLSMSSSRVRTLPGGDSNRAKRSNSRRDRWIGPPSAVTTRRAKLTWNGPAAMASGRDASGAASPGVSWVDNAIRRKTDRMRATNSAQPVGLGYVILRSQLEGEHDVGLGVEG